MKTCFKCNTSKSLDQFGANKAKADGLQVQCKDCRKVTNAESYIRTKGYQNPKRAASHAAHLERGNQFIREYLQEHPCVDCGEDDLVVLQFDHQGDKIANVSSLRHCALSKLAAEIAKCEVVCANCHIRRTAKTFSWWRTRG